MDSILHTYHVDQIVNELTPLGIDLIQGLEHRLVRWPGERVFIPALFHQL